MVPIQYIIDASDIDAALATGCRWLQLRSGHELTHEAAAELLERCHSGGTFLVLTDDLECCTQIGADGVLLTTAGIASVASRIPEPSGIVLQRPRPIALAIGEARRTLGEDSPQFVGVVAETPDDAIAAAKAGADFIQVPLASPSPSEEGENCPPSSLIHLKPFIESPFTTPIVALGAIEAESIAALLEAGISGIASTIDDVPPVMIPLLLNADEQ